MSDAEVPSQCYQCPKPPMYLLPADTGGKIPLCLDCYSKWHRIHAEEQRQRAALLNYYSQSIEESVFGMGYGPRLQMPPEPSMSTHVRIDRANVGLVNTGSIENVESAVGYIQNAGNDHLAAAFKVLTEAVLSAQDATADRKQELVEMLSVLSREAAQPPEKQSKLTMRKLLPEAATMLKSVGSIAAVVEKCWPLIIAAFGG